MAILTMEDMVITDGRIIAGHTIRIGVHRTITDTIPLVTIHIVIMVTMITGILIMEVILIIIMITHTITGRVITDHAGQ
jgi:hypothetical protein